MNTQVMFSHASDEWATPLSIFTPLHEEFGFTLDVAAGPKNFKCPRYFSQEDNALEQSWAGETCWMNPPYSLVKAFLAKAVVEVENDPSTTVVGLLPSRTDTKWFHTYCYGVASEIRFLKGRVKFISDVRIRKGTSNSAPFPSIIVVWG